MGFSTATLTGRYKATHGRIRFKTGQRPLTLLLKKRARVSNARCKPEGKEISSNDNDCVWSLYGLQATSSLKRDKSYFGEAPYCTNQTDQKEIFHTPLFPAIVHATELVRS